MFTPADRLPAYDGKEGAEFQNRWHSEPGFELREKILEKIKAGAGEDFLQWEFQQGQLPVLEDEWDLRGFYIHGEDIDFPEGDNFENIDFAYARFYQTTFRNACFVHGSLKFADFHGCRFVNCIFYGARFYGSVLSDVEFEGCDFPDTQFVNCDCRSLRIIDSFFEAPIFEECRFDPLTRIGSPTLKAKRIGRDLKKRTDAEIFRSMYEAYTAGNAPDLARKYFFDTNAALTRFDTPERRSRWIRRAEELLWGYGVRPLRPLAWIAFLCTFVTSIFGVFTNLSLPDAFLVATGAVFTFGARADALNALGWPLRLLYTFSAFAGVFLTGLFVTTLAFTMFRRY